jgi:hypothetical protein
LLFLFNFFRFSFFVTRQISRNSASVFVISACGSTTSLITGFSILEIYFTLNTNRCEPEPNHNHIARACYKIMKQGLRNAHREQVSKLVRALLRVAGVTCCLLLHVGVIFFGLWIGIGVVIVANVFVTNREYIRGIFQSLQLFFVSLHSFVKSRKYFHECERIIDLTESLYCRALNCAQVVQHEQVVRSIVQFWKDRFDEIQNPVQVQVCFVFK